MMSDQVFTSRTQVVDAGSAAIAVPFGVSTVQIPALRCGGHFFVLFA
jgi:hypothetical protein